MIRLISLLAILLVLPPAAPAQGAEYVEGTHYQVLSPPLHTRDPGKIEVLEFFWYGCSHCHNFEPLIKQWQKTMPEDVYYVGSPAIWNGPMRIHAQAFYTAQAMGVLELMHDALFAAMNVDRKRLASEQELGQIFAAHGVDEDQFHKVFNSFGVNSQTDLANARGRNARITGTPELMVAGKYRITTRMAGGPVQMLRVADFLVERERAAR